MVGNQIGILQSRLVWELYQVSKYFDNTFNSFDIIAACNRLIDGQIDILRAGSIVHAIHTRLRAR